MDLNPYLFFSGNCEAAFKFYEKCLGGKIDYIVRNGESPLADQTPRDRHDKILHMRMSVGQQVIMGSDAPPDHFQTPQGFSISLNIPDRAQGERVFNALAEGGTVTMPFAKTFWAEGFGMLKDRFGIPWMVNCEQAK